MGIFKDLNFAVGVLRRRPLQCLIQVTNRCNMTCSFCDFWPNGVPPPQELSLDDFRRIEEDLSRLGTFVISVEGGEPFLRPELIEIIRILGRRHLPVLYTNGWYVTRKRAEDLFEAGLAEAAVSVDYASAERHDTKRGLSGAFERAWHAARFFKEAAPRGGRQVHMMTVVMKDNQDDLEPLLRLSAAAGVAHNITLISKSGYRRGKADLDQLPDPEVGDRLLELWERYPHFKVFKDYLEGVRPFLGGGDLPECRAGVQSFNIDHLGGVSPCIEKIDVVMGNVRRERLADILAKPQGREAVAGCQDCWTNCRGFNQVLGRGGAWGGWRDLASRVRA